VPRGLALAMAHLHLAQDLLLAGRPVGQKMRQQTTDIVTRQERPLLGQHHALHVGALGLNQAA
jgi:hypothetical protein